MRAKPIFTSVQPLTDLEKLRIALQQSEDMQRAAAADIEKHSRALQDAQERERQALEWISQVQETIRQLSILNSAPTKKVS
jgi:uncharacterized membrane protein YgaE (UPF0421/DUF939 family)